MLKDRAFYKLGLFVYDQRKAMMALGPAVCHDRSVHHGR